MEAMTHLTAGQLQSFFRQLPGIRVSPEDVPLSNSHPGCETTDHSSEHRENVAKDV